MLSIAVHKDEHLTSCRTNSTFYSGTVADVVRMTENNCPGIMRNFRGVVFRTIIDDNYLSLGEVSSDPVNDLSDGFLLIKSWYDNRNFLNVH